MNVKLIAHTALSDDFRESLRCDDADDPQYNFDNDRAANRTNRNPHVLFRK